MSLGLYVNNYLKLGERVLGQALHVLLLVDKQSVLPVSLQLAGQGGLYQHKDLQENHHLIKIFRELALIQKV